MPATRDTKLLTRAVLLASIAVSLSMAQSPTSESVTNLGWHDCDSVSKCIGAVGRALAFR